MADNIEAKLPTTESGNSHHSEHVDVAFPTMGALADPEHRARVERSMKRKLDRRCSFFVLIYIMNYLDRNNIAAARLRGLQDDLRLSNSQYATCLSILYVGYILMQVPSNMLINRIQRPSVYIACAMVLWGLLSVLSGATKDFSVDIVEGGVTMFIALLAPFILPDLPHNTKGFTDEELLVAQLRMTEDVGEVDADSVEQGIFSGLFLAVKDIKVYILMLVFTAYTVGLSFNAFFPTLTGTLGFGYVPTLLMSSPPWAFACVVMLLNAWHSDRRQERACCFWHILWPMGMGITGFVISMSTENIAARYVALHLQAGSYAGFFLMYSWISSTFPRPPAKRAVALALINAFSQLGNVAGSYVWNLPDNGYRGSYGVVTSMFGITIVGCTVFRFVLVRLNNKIENGADPWETHQDLRERTAEIAREEGSKKSPSIFRYLL
ncbi:hypothetical protein FOIG_11329 [Fusarium odoratissimum NRRL 54006]|uniref:Major facilitator superfamily (MFS) profile domain-containing protein n=1 Tax=Fusarium odoratissimum (strain NRRL 54006) TaxID=1089451 RepID=X0KHM0_FUSO5|nr:uncharacterized protein FOIG_11329 [Fusarium odoratissimum NRRL 54006]EXL96369.1 hypothetical protein FOIG_11329 [Fusarium odoratissimum NRRL 54006]